MCVHGASPPDLKLLDIVVELVHVGKAVLGGLVLLHALPHDGHVFDPLCNDDPQRVIGKRLQSGILAIEACGYVSGPVVLELVEHSRA